jgi:hypothetical protein
LKKCNHPISNYWNEKLNTANTPAQKAPMKNENKGNSVVNFKNRFDPNNTLLSKL